MDCRRHASTTSQLPRVMHRRGGSAHANESSPAETKAPRRDWRTKIPNALTLGRVIAVPFLALSFYFPGREASGAWTHVPGILFLLSALTDALDGYLARRWSVQSEFGAFLDPVADKMLVSWLRPDYPRITAACFPSRRLAPTHKDPSLLERQLAYSRIPAHPHLPSYAHHKRLHDADILVLTCEFSLQVCTVLCLLSGELGAIVAIPTGVITCREVTESFPG